MREEESVLSEELKFITCHIKEADVSLLKRLKYTIFSQNQLDQYAELLGKKYKIDIKQKSSPLRAELFRNKKSLKKAYFYFAESDDKNEPIASGSEWLVDNFPLLEQQIKTSEDFLLEKLDEKLPKLTEGPFKGFPRIYWIAEELIEHTDAVVSEQNLVSFIENFQKNQPLMMRELWGFSKMLTLVIVKKLTQLSAFNVEARKQQLTADKLIHEIFSQSSKNPSDLVMDISLKMQKNPHLWRTGTAVFLLKKLKEQGTKGALCYQWIDQKILEMGCRSSEIIENFLHMHSINQISISNCFACFRNLSIHNWKDFVEGVSFVHHILKKDPADIYKISDFRTRNRCRYQIEKIADKIGKHENEVAQKLVDFSSKQTTTPASLNSVCYFLIDEGLIAFEEHIKYVPPLMTKFSRWVKKRVFTAWVSAHAIATIFFLSFPLYYIYELKGDFLSFMIVFLGFFILASKIASQLIQWFVFYLTDPLPLPKLDLKLLGKEEHNTLIILHTIFRNRKSILENITELEILSIANNKSPNLFFALAADLPDSNEKVLPDDSDLISYAETLIKKLNKHTDRFFLITRTRSWSTSEKKFIGWERKRGKIHQINQFILGNEVQDIHLDVGEACFLKTCRYVITLDEDTKIPPDMAKILIATIAHPLNMPHYDNNLKKITRGYTIIQPTIESSLQESLKSYFSKIFASAPGMDPYSDLISNTYQDLFKEGSYVGKAIYDVSAFEKGLKGRIPENKILSHDLLEGLFTQVGYVSDAIFIDTFPSNYITFANRLHRWIRGDWQLIPWLFSKIPNTNNVMGKSPISPIGRWKIFDNLLRSLVFLVSFFLIIAAFSILPGSCLVWAGFIFFAINFNILLDIFNIAIIPFTHPLLFVPLFFKNFQVLKTDIAQAVLRTTLIPSLALTTGHAIATALYRMIFSHKYLLEWTPTAVFEKKAPVTTKAIFKKMLPEWSITFFLMIYISFVYCVGTITCCAPIFLLWLLAPFIVYKTNQPPYKKKVFISNANKEKLEKIAFETWSFFNELSVKETNYLIPDNIQLTPQETVAKRTSPTNIGFQLISTLSAYDLGFIFLDEMLDKVEKTLETVGKLEKCHGHLYNWYNIETLNPLYPKYVSSVDSGNFVSYCITLRSALKEFNEAPVITAVHRQYKDSSLYKHNIFLHLVQTLYSLEVETQELDKEIQSKLLYFIERYQNGEVPTWIALRNDSLELLDVCHFAESTNQDPSLLEKMHILSQEIKTLHFYCNNILKRNHLLIEVLTEIIQKTDFNFLYSESEDLLAIGYQVDTGVLDPNYYNLLASEASITSLLAIGKGDIPYKSWFSLGRQLIRCKHGKTLLSWSGSAFEYLMPAILINPLHNTLLKKSFEVVVQEQKHYGKTHKLPWGISESGYAITDIEGNYQYRAFGIPNLGLKRGLENDYVVSPYSTFLSLIIDPLAALKNIEALEQEGGRGKYGFYESIDYTAQRLTNGEKSYILKSFLAHHQGMILTSINNLINKGVLQKRFQSCALIKAIDILLQEPFPFYAAPIALTRPKPLFARKSDVKPLLKQIQRTPHTFFPHTHVLSNGKLSQMIDNSGSGFLFWEKNIALTRWTEDAEQNDYGYYIFIKDLDTEQVWSVGFQPTKVQPDFYEVVYGPEKVEFSRKDHGIFLKMEITISPEHDMEIRKLTFKNESGRRRRLEITSYGEVVLKNLDADASHRTFSNMFVESSFNADFDSLIFKRRPRSHDDKEVFMAHTVVASSCWSRIQFETDRAHFIGRGNTIHNAQVLEKKTALSNTTGSTLDPIFSLRVIVVVDEEKLESISLVTAIAASKEELLQIIPTYYSPYSVARAFELSFAKSNIELRYERIPFDKIHLYQEFTKCIFFHIDPYRPGKEARKKNTLQQESLWRFGISGDIPLILVHLKQTNQLNLVKELLTAHHYLSLKGLIFDLVILNEVKEGYRTEFLNTIEDTIAKFGTSNNYLLNAQQLTQEDMTLLEAVSHMIYGPQDERLIPSTPADVHEFVNKRAIEKKEFYAVKEDLLRDVLFFNGYGGFIDQGKAYRIFKPCPHPWSNVIGSHAFGFLVTETGGGYTFSENCQANRLSPWRPDPVSDLKGEMLYIRNSRTKKIYCPLSVPMAICEHHFGFSRFFMKEEDFTIEVVISSSLEKKVKFWKLYITNPTEKELDLEYYLVVDWLLGTLSSKSKPHLVCDYDKQNQIVYVVNSYNHEFSHRIAFMGSSEDVYSFTTSRREFIGRNQDFNSPHALQTDKLLAPLKNAISSGTDALGAVHIVTKLFPHEEKEFLFYLGEESSLQAAKDASLNYSSLAVLHEEFTSVQNYWKEMTTKIAIKTPDVAFNTLMNGWLIYQTLTARLFAKTGYYQSSGAIGFRDQLQDTLALLAINPDLTRKQLLLHASRQFIEGDVQHWWNPQSEKGVRTKISDDYLWLPYVLLKYLEVTHDQTILEEKVSYLEADILKDDEQEVYIKPRKSEKIATLYEHCTLAIERALKLLGAHGLPLMGCGDWNDGMNQVGVQGKGESIWLGWFLYDILHKFSQITPKELGERYLREAKTLLENIESFGWDGKWYRRAYFDNGTPIGSSTSEECKIDSIAQSWSVIANSKNLERQEQAMDSALEHLVSEKDSLIALLTPPFNKMALNPGYIKSYPSGVRENGGQYTHAAAWLVLATALLKKGNKAFELFSMINPIHHTLDQEQVEKYLGEPFVLAGDVYSTPPLNGQAGWTWYTGSAGWLYHVGLEALLGLKISGDTFTIDPCIPSLWKEFSIKYKVKNRCFTILVRNAQGVESGVAQIMVNGKIREDKKILLQSQDYQELESIDVEVTMGEVLP
jgi:cyclic beta-1,2-glucan synthetase